MMLNFGSTILLCPICNFYRVGLYHVSCSSCDHVSIVVNWYKLSRTARKISWPYERLAHLIQNCASFWVIDGQWSIMKVVSIMLTFSTLELVHLSFWISCPVTGFGLTDTCGRNVLVLFVLFWVWHMMCYWKISRLKLLKVKW